MNSTTSSWQRFKECYSEYPDLALALDISRMNFDSGFLDRMRPSMERAFDAMGALEAGAIANPDENRMVGHYWLRNPTLAPTTEIRKDIEATLGAIKAFAAKVHGGAIQGANGSFEQILLIGIGGSALGPQFVSHALGHPRRDKMRFAFFDNTDPDGMERVLSGIPDLGKTLCVVISKSGGTKETRNGMLEAKAAFERAGLDFARHAVAVTGVGSELDTVAERGGWIARFPMWDWVGGRTSELSAVGLLPAALQGFDIDELLAGAKACDEATRARTLERNPAALLALMWFWSGNGNGAKNMVVLPYKDRLELFSKYLQQLIMESLGKERDAEGRIVNQGLTVFGNKGATDQHAYVQHLRDGSNNFFAVFIEVLRQTDAAGIQVESSFRSGDYLNGFLLGTRGALSEKGRESLTITISEVSAFSVGVLIALFERAVGFYASLVNINAYHQPGVEAGKKGAARVLEIQHSVTEFLQTQPNTRLTADEIARGLGRLDDAEMIFKVCEALAANEGRGICKHPGRTPFEAMYEFVEGL